MPRGKKSNIVDINSVNKAKAEALKRIKELEELEKRMQAGTFTPQEKEEDKVVSVVTTPMAPFTAPSTENVVLGTNFDPKKALDNAFTFGTKQSESYFKLAVYLRDNGYVRQGGSTVAERREAFVLKSKEDAELNEGMSRPETEKWNELNAKKNAWDFLASLYEKNGWPKKEKTGRFLSSVSAEPILGKGHPALLRVNAFRNWVGVTFQADSWVERPMVPQGRGTGGNTTPPPPPTTPEEVKAELQAVADQTLAEFNAGIKGTGVSINPKLDNLDADIPAGVPFAEQKKAAEAAAKKAVAKTVVQTVHLGVVEGEELAKLQKEVLTGIIKAKGKYSDKAKMLAAELLSELHLAEDENLATAVNQ